MAKSFLIEHGSLKIYAHPSSPGDGTVDRLLERLPAPSAFMSLACLDEAELAYLQPLAGSAMVCSVDGRDLAFLKAVADRCRATGVSELHLV